MLYKKTEKADKTYFSSFTKYQEMVKEREIVMLICTSEEKKKSNCQNWNKSFKK